MDGLSCLSVCLCLNALAQFSRYEAQTSQAGRGLGGTDLGGTDNFTVPQGA